MLCRSSVMPCENRKEAHRHLHKNTNIGTHTTCPLRHSCKGATANVLPHVCTHVSGQVVTRTWPVWHTEGKEESYMIGASIAACRSWHNEFNTIGSIWQPCQHLAASAWEIHTRMPIPTQAWVSQTLPGASLHLAKAWLWQTQHLMVGYWCPRRNSNTDTIPISYSTHSTTMS